MPFFNFNFHVFGQENRNVSLLLGCLVPYILNRVKKKQEFDERHLGCGFPALDTESFTQRG